MKRDDYKLGKILATSAIISDVPLGSEKPRRTKLKLVILALILIYAGYAFSIHRADAQTTADSVYQSYSHQVGDIGDDKTDIQLHQPSAHGSPKYRR